MKILATKSYQYLSRNFLESAQQKGFCASELSLEEKKFPDGELCLKISDPEKIRDESVAIFAGITNFESIFELYNLACEVVSLGCSKLHIVIPYLAYATQDQKNEIGEVATLKNIAQLLSSVPQSPQGNQIYLVDVHNPIVLNYFEGKSTASLISTKNLIKKIITKISEKNSIDEKLQVLASVDMGRAQLISEIADELSLSRIFIEKKRISPEETQIVSVSDQNIAEKLVIIYDDMIRTGSSLLNAAEYYRSAGAKKIIAIISHGIFANSAFEKIKQSKSIDKIFCFNTHPNVFAQPCSENFLEICDISEVLLENLINVVCSGK